MKGVMDKAIDRKLEESRMVKRIKVIVICKEK